MSSNFIKEYTHTHLCVFCSCVNTLNYSITLLRPEHTLLHKAKDILVLRRMEKAAASTGCYHTYMTVFTNGAHSHSSAPSREHGKRFSTVWNQNWVQSPLGAHISVTESRLHYLRIVHSGLSLYLFLVSFLETITPANNLHLFGMKRGFYSCGSSATWCVRSHWLYKLTGRVGPIVCCIL